MPEFFGGPLKELTEYAAAQRELEKGAGPVWISGCLDSQKVHLIHELRPDVPKRIVVTYSESQAKMLYEDYRFFDRNVYLYPAKDLLFFGADIKGNQLTAQRVRVLKAMLTEASWTVVTTVDACLEELIPLDVWNGYRIEWDGTGRIEDMAGLAAQLTALGYSREAQVEAPGQFAVRGGILDLFVLTEENPVRVELWGDEIDSIRSFDSQSQRSLDGLDRITVYPATQELPSKSKVSFLDYAGEDSLIFLDEPARAAEMAEAVEEEYKESLANRRESGYEGSEEMPQMYSFSYIKNFFEDKNSVLISGLEQRPGDFACRKKYNLAVKSSGSYQNNFEMLIKDLQGWKKAGYRVVLLSASRTRAERLAKDLQDEYDLRAYYSEDVSRPIQPGEILVTWGTLHRGFEYPLIRFAVITETDLFGIEKKKRRKRKTYDGKHIQDFSELSAGDYVVHENHGIGIYRGIEKIEVDKVVKDYIKVEYGDGGNLYLPVTQLDLIQKYAGADSRKPKLNRLNGGDWGRTKTRVKGAVAQIAQDLVKLYAARQAESGFVYSADTVWQTEFEELFPYEMTQDQELAVEAVKADMESARIMDRLICGDVGYGKTEIALRAAFKAVQDGKQVVYLVPTTILAQQHYNTFVQRMMDFPVHVAQLSRFSSPAEQKKTLEGLKNGMVDIVIGTHRVLSKDVKFKNLGLLVIDEEQRFGVTHKEKIKQMRENVDVLTLTATPIPRTLHMSLVGIRDMSVLEEAPVERVPIQTYVMEYHDEMVREAIKREMARGGQVYYVYNRVKNIDEVAARVASLVPEANVAFAHGQMPERKLENIMLDFINGEIDVLISTTIIETGLDISNVNTIIIQDADRFGLSQLYQLRGRVGRSNRTAYAFLMYKKDKLLKEEAEKRLSAIREFTELGSGIKIAMKDLEIRGAGNILGAEQHGHMEAVGYDLYCKLLNDAVRHLKGEKVEADFETTVDFPVSAYIPSSYIRNEALKMEIYKRIAAVSSEEEKEDMQDELIDRFGDIPKPVVNLLKVAELKALAHRACVTELSGNLAELKFTMYAQAEVDTEQIPELLKRYGGALKFVASENPYFSYLDRKREIRDLEGMMAKAKELLTDGLLPIIK
jgi:transcription-repair coupling factor (superfamily II helicase)